jgi:hypothetical protein
VGRVSSASSSAAAAGCPGCARQPPYSAPREPLSLSWGGMGGCSGVASPRGTRRSTGLRTHPGSACGREGGGRTAMKKLRIVKRIWHFVIENGH